MSVHIVDIDYSKRLSNERLDISKGEKLLQSLETYSKQLDRLLEIIDDPIKRRKKERR